MLSQRERQFLRGELDDRPKEYLANLKSTIQRKLKLLKSTEVQLILDNPRLRPEYRNLDPIHAD